MYQVTITGFIICFKFWLSDVIMIDLNLFSVLIASSLQFASDLLSMENFLLLHSLRMIPMSVKSKDLEDDNQILITIFIYFVKCFVISNYYLHLLNIRSYIYVWFSLILSWILLYWLRIKIKNNNKIKFNYHVYVHTTKLYLLK